MKIFRLLIISTIAAFLFLLAMSVYFLFYLNPSPQEKVLFINAVVYTMDDQNTLAEAVLIERNRIVATGSEEELLPEADNADIINLEGKALVPGFIDVHGHFFSSRMNITFADGLNDLSISVKDYLVQGVTSVRAALPNKAKNKPLELLSQIGIIPQRVFIQMNHKAYTNSLVQPLNSISTAVETVETVETVEPESVHEAIFTSLRNFTIEAAILLKVDKKIGSIEPGKLADFIVLSDNPVAYPQQLDQIHVDQTWIGGVKRFDRHEFSEDDDRLPASQP